MKTCDLEQNEILDKIINADVSRRDFMKFSAGLAAMMGLPLGMAPKIANAITNPKKPPVIWISFQQCTGCTETLLRSRHPTLENLILDIISLDYNETLSTPAGKLAEEARDASMKANKGKYVLVVDGSIPMAQDGIFCKIGGRKAKDLLKESAENAAAVIAMGSCAAWGGLPSAPPNPTGAIGVPEALKQMGVKTPCVTIPGCPPSPYNFLSTVVHYLTFSKLPELDDKGRPKFAYGKIIHDNCERRAHFDAGRFAQTFGDENHRNGYCLFKLGCKGPETFANCPSILFGDVGSGSWPVGTGHPCFGCTEPGVGFFKPLHSLAIPKSVAPPSQYPGINEQRGSGLGYAATALAAGVAGAALGAGAVVQSKLGKADDVKDNEKKG